MEPLVRLVLDAAEKGLRQRFAETRAARNYPAGDVEAGRAYIEQYVPFVHYVAGLYAAATTSVVGHEAEAETAAEHEKLPIRRRDPRRWSELRTGSSALALLAPLYAAARFRVIVIDVEA